MLQPYVKCTLGWALTVLAALLAANAAAQTSTYPSKPIRILVPFPAGGSTDLLARGIGERLTAVFGQPVVADNRLGADGVVATDIVAKSVPDGYTLLMVAIGHAANASLYPNLPYDTLHDFQGVVLAADVPMVLITRPALKVNSVSELIALAREKPDTLNCASGGVGASLWYSVEVPPRASRISVLSRHWKRKAFIPISSWAPAPEAWWACSTPAASTASSCSAFRST